MIIGVGTDIADINRIGRMIEQHGDRVIEKLFTEPEIVYCKGMANPAIHFAGRWAAKEAFFKALPESIQKWCTWKTFQIVARDGKRKPMIEIIDSGLGNALAREGINSIHHSISHELAGYCVAFVVLEQRK
jgi:holo-[acyl-carrier protein] synthase